VLLDHQLQIEATNEVIKICIAFHIHVNIDFTRVDIGPCI